MIFIAPREWQMDAIVPVAQRVKATVHRNCVGSDNARAAGEDNGATEKCEFLVYLAVPSAGGDGILLGVAETEGAAETIASVLNSVLSLAHAHA